MIGVRFSDCSDMNSRGIHAIPNALLSKARCPAVMVELGSLTNPEDEQRLIDPSFQLSLADGASRQLARYVGTIARWQGTAVQPTLVFRPDRFLRGGVLVFGPFRALIDPSAQQPNFLRRQRRPARRHLRLHLIPGDHVNQPAPCRISGEDRRPRVPPAKRVGFAVQPQPAHLVRGTVTARTALLENRADLRVEIHRAACRGRQLLRRRQSECERERQDRDGESGAKHWLLAKHMPRESVNGRIKFR